MDEYAWPNTAKFVKYLLNQVKNYCSTLIIKIMSL